MNRKLTIRVVWVLAAAAMLGGVSLAVYASSAIRSASVRLTETARLVDQLKGDLQKTVRTAQARELYSKLPPLKADALQECLSSTVGAQVIDDSRDVRQDMGQGWSARQKELTFNDVPVSRVMDFVRKAEALRPPWIMTRCQIRSSPSAAGTAQITVVMETVERKP